MQNYEGNAAAEMPRYRSHKTVWALQIADEPININSDGTVTFAVADVGYAPVTVTKDVVARYMPVNGDFYVVYADGYKSFSPGKAFREGYTREAAQSYQQRIIDEEKELSERLRNLGRMIHGPVFDSMSAEDQTLLQEQWEHMCAYVLVLRKRIARFAKT